MIGTKHGTYIVLKQSGKDFECSNGKQVIRLSKEDIEAGNWSKGELMFNIAPVPEKVEVKVKPKAKPKRKTKKK